MAAASIATRRQRAAAQMLHRPPGLGAVDVARSLLAVQAQELRAARLALRARGELFTAADVDAAISEQRTLVRGWLGRGTLHLVAREDYWWLLAITAQARYAANKRRLRQEGVSEDDAERTLAIVERVLADEGPLPRATLAERIAAEGIRTEGQAIAHLMLLATLRAVTVLGPVRHGAQDFVLARDWLGEPEPPDRDAALAELARRYLAGHGPATAADLAAWIGLPLRDARAGIAAISGEIVELGGDMLDLVTNDPAPEPVPARLLPAFDPYLLGWKNREFAVPPENAREVHPGGGIVRPTVTVDGVVVGTWSRRDGLKLFDPLPASTATELEVEAADILRFEAG
jgi:Winged helix DNA-binding domain